MKHPWKWAVTITLLGMASAHGQAPESVDVTSASIVQRMDRSGDGKIGVEEFRNAMMRVYSTADADGNGVPSGPEIPMHSTVVEKSMAAGNQVKRSDYSAALQPVFESFDADHDGLLASDEIEAFAQARRSVKEVQP